MTSPLARSTQNAERHSRVRAEWAAEVTRGGCGVPGCDDPDCEISYAECHGGCGQRTKLAPQSHRSRNLVLDEPYLYVVGHSTPGGCPGRTLVARDDGLLLLEVRENKGLGQNALARKARTSNTTISQLEGLAGRRTSQATAGRIAKALGVDVDEIFAPATGQERRAGRTRPRRAPQERYDGAAAKAASAASVAYRGKHGLLMREEVATFLGVHPSNVTRYVRCGLLDVAAESDLGAVRVTYFSDETVRRFALERLRADDRRIKLRFEPDYVRRHALRIGLPVEHVDELAAAAQKRKAVLGGRLAREIAAEKIAAGTKGARPPGRPRHLEGEIEWQDTAEELLEAGWRQQDIAEHIGVSRDVIQRFAARLRRGVSHKHA